MKRLIQSRNHLSDYLKNHPLRKTIFGAFFVCGVIVSSAVVYLSTTQLQIQKQAQIDKTNLPMQNDLVRIAARSATDTTPPQVAFVNPQDGLTLIANTNLTIQVIASDDVHVSKVEIFIDDLLLKTCLSMMRCQTDMSVNKLSTGEHTLRSVVKDSGNNEASAQISLTK